MTQSTTNALEAPEATSAPHRPCFVLAATFTADPLVEPLSFLAREAGLDLDVEVTPYGQVFQELLDPGRLFAINRGGVNVVMLRFEDWWRDAGAGGAARLDPQRILHIARELVAALRQSASRTPTPTLVCVCPASARARESDAGRQLLPALEEVLVSGVAGLPTVRVLDLATVASLEAEEVHDPEGDRLGHVPYTPLFFAGLGSAVARTARAMRSPPKKVLALDCDNTLWDGVVGEDGVHGIALTPRHLALQRFVLEKKRAGMIVCLVSKNAEADVLDVFRERQEMVLRLEDIVSLRVNWLPKSENLRSLAAELNLGLDSFAFIDDNPMECAEVEAGCPGTLVLQLPTEDDFPRFLGNVWPLDQIGLTEADRNRTELYRQNLERTRFARDATSLADFVSGLELVVEVAEPTRAEMARAAQLTQRTNQFNFTGRRRSEGDLSLLAREGLETRVVRVRDRFGDYGLVGVMIFAASDDRLLVDTFLLSCRVLGRGVEHQMIRVLGAVAQERGLAEVAAPFIPTPKNSPAKRFLDSLKGERRDRGGGEVDHVMSAALAASLAYAPGEGTPELISDEPTGSGKTPDAIQEKSARWNHIARDLDTPQKILQDLARAARRSRTAKERPVRPRTETERKLAALWTEVLQIPEVGIRDDYFALGGTSLLAVQVFARIERELGVRLPLVTLMESPTIEGLAGRIDGKLERTSLVLLGESDGTAAPLFLVHDADGETLLYRNLARRLAESRPVYGIQPSGRGGAAIAHTTIEEMAAHYVLEIRRVRLHGPYLLGGLCAGGVLAFEMARQLEAEHEEARLVAVFDAADVEAARKPHLETARRMDRLRQAIGAGSLRELPRVIAAKARGYLAYQVSHRIRAARERMAVATLRVCLKRDLPLPAWARKVSARSVYLFAESAYRPKAVVQDEIVLFRATSGEGADEPYVRLYEDPLLGWQKRSARGVKVFDVPGGHGSMLQEPNVAVVAETLGRYLAD